MNLVIFAIVLFSVLSFSKACDPSETTVSGTEALESICSGALIFEENFNSLDQSKWRHEVTMAGGGNNEFQWFEKLNRLF
jgi:hypothetical protein